MATLAAVAAVAVGAVAGAPVGPVQSRWHRRREDRLVGAELPTLLDEVARSVRSGLSVTAALAAARTSVDGPLGADIDALLGSSGGSSAALDGWASRRADVPGVRLVVAALTTAGRAGAAARAIDGVADTLRAEREVTAEVRALASQAQVSALLIATLPLGFALLSAAADPAAVGFLVRSDIGRLCLVVGVGLDLGALWWMRRIVRSIR